MSIEGTINNYLSLEPDPSPNPIYVLLGIDAILKFESDKDAAEFFLEELPTYELNSPYIYIFQETESGDIEKYVMEKNFLDEDNYSSGLE